jgi:cell division transport system ATP-binding protein
MWGIGHRNSQRSDYPFVTSPIFRSMSRTPVKSSSEPDVVAPRDQAILRVQRAAPRPPRRNDEARALVSFSLEPGDAHVLAGETGSGKTALLEMIGLARPPARGGVELFGLDLGQVEPRDRYRLRRRMGFIFQNPRLVEDLSSRDNIALAAEAAGRRPADYASHIEELLAWVGLGRRADMMAGGLDEEGRRRLAVARAVINRPDLLIADEPGLESGMVILKLLADLNEAGTTILMATQDLDLAARSGAQVTLLTHATSARPDPGEPVADSSAP